MILLDASILIDPPMRWPGPVVGSSMLCLAELEFGIHRAPDAASRSLRVQRMARYKAAFEWIPFEESDAASYGVLAARVARRRPAHARSADIMIAAQALTLGVPLLTRHARDFELVSYLVEILDGNSPDAAP